MGGGGGYGSDGLGWDHLDWPGRDSPEQGTTGMMGDGGRAEMARYEIDLMADAHMYPTEYGDGGERKEVHTDMRRTDRVGPTGVVPRKYPGGVRTEDQDQDQDQPNPTQPNPARAYASRVVAAETARTPSGITQGWSVAHWSGLGGEGIGGLLSRWRTRKRSVIVVRSNDHGHVPRGMNGWMDGWMDDRSRGCQVNGSNYLLFGLPQERTQASNASNAWGAHAGPRTSRDQPDCLIRIRRAPTIRFFTGLAGADGETIGILRLHRSCTGNDGTCNVRLITACSGLATGSASAGPPPSYRLGTILSAELIHYSIAHPPNGTSQFDATLSIPGMPRMRQPIGPVAVQGD
ncbi:hypothetical protein BO70DRAFT_382231 [Aspergillus heteromorphus CBS 117.55]|uniref:Uncharacterized protein n=1 Tax=Aspergillus heteromorphus CBS 117.55 TaxID=1448321 RepID=A0A317VEV4_9EURO|nr:uncharacterized protein BO70DRAFT_382231 [Aspergillus heteromorphus CBS 117.55]PWY70410.1 hypothetical protein BO70DRAFT_382231 [Aspergillus heteromorphus CBS 117.55]